MDLSLNEKEEKLKKEAEKRGPDFTLVFLSSHPALEERIKNVKAEIEKLKQGTGQ